MDTTQLCILAMALLAALAMGGLSALAGAYFGFKLAKGSTPTIPLKLPFRRPNPAAVTKSEDSSPDEPAEDPAPPRFTYPRPRA